MGSRQPEFVYGSTAAMLALGMWRLWLVRAFRRMYRQHPLRWRNLFYGFTALAASMWGAFSAYTVTLLEPHGTELIVYLATARISRLRVVAEKTLAAAFCSAVLLLPALIAVAVLGSHLGVGTDNILRGIGGTLLVSTVYAAVFVTVGLLLKRALVAGIIYILVWEGAIATVAPSADRVSMTAWGRAITDGGIYGLQSDLMPTQSALSGVVALVAVTLAAVALGGWRLSRMDLP